MRVRAVAVLVIAAALLTACEEKGLGEAAKGVGTVQTVDCPGSARAVDLPAGFVAPLPRGTVVVDVRHGDKDRTVVTGVVPAEQKDVLAQLQKAYPAAGLTLTEGETEEIDLVVAPLTS
jgi:hypothetical protein